VKKLYPSQVATGLPLIENKNTGERFTAQFVRDNHGNDGPVVHLVYTKKLGVSSSVKECQNQVKNVTGQLIKKYGTPFVDNNRRPNPMKLKWIPDSLKKEWYPSQHSNSMVNAEFICSSDALLTLKIHTSGGYVSNYMKYMMTERKKLEKIEREQKRKEELMKINPKQELNI